LPAAGMVCGLFVYRSKERFTQSSQRGAEFAPEEKPKNTG
jgi:hypothetical protein